MYHPNPWHGARWAAVANWQNAWSGAGTLNILDGEPLAGRLPTDALACGVLTVQAGGYKKPASQSESSCPVDAERRRSAGRGQRTQPESESVVAGPVWDAPVGETPRLRIRKRICRPGERLRRNAVSAAPLRSLELRNRPSGLLQRTVPGISYSPYYRSLPAGCDRDLSPSVNSGKAVGRSGRVRERGTLGDANPNRRGRHGCGPAQPGKRGCCGADPTPGGHIAPSGRPHLRWYGAVLGSILRSGPGGERLFSSVSLIGQRYSIDIAGPGR